MYRVIAQLVFFYLVATTAQAVALKQGTLEQALTPSLLFQHDPALTRDTRLRELTQLMESGKRNEANLKIAEMLAKNPKDKDALELAGISLMQMKNFKAAEESFRRLAALPPVKASVITKYGVTKILNGDIDRGVKLLQQILEHTPNDALANRYLGWVAENTGNPDFAATYLARLPSIPSAGLQEYHVALARNYKNIGAFDKITDLFAPLFVGNKIEDNQLSSGAAFYLTLAYAATGKVEKSAQLAAVLTPMISDDPLNLFGLKMGMAQIAGNEKTGRKALEQLVEAVPGAEAAGRFEMAKLYLNTNNVPEAIGEFEATIKRVDEEETTNILRTLIPLLMQENMSSHAIHTMRELVTKYPSNDGFLFGLAELQTVSGMNKEASVTITQLLDRPQPYAPAYLLGAKLASAQGQTKLARHYLSENTRVRPDDAEGWIALARFHVNQRDLQGAIRSLQAGVQANPTNASLEYELGTLHQARGDFELANQQYRNAMKLNANYLQAMDNLASNLLDGNQNIEEAHVLAQRLYQARPQDPYIQDLMGWALYRMGDLSGASEHLEKAAPAITDSGRADYHLALALRDRGDRERAARYFKSALDKGLLEPLLGEASAALIELR